MLPDGVHFRTFGLACHDCGYATTYWSDGVSWPCGCGFAHDERKRTRREIEHDIDRAERYGDHVTAPLTKPNPRGVSIEVPRPLAPERRHRQPAEIDALWRMMHELVGAG